MKIVPCFLAVFTSLLTLFGISQTVSKPDAANLLLTLVFAFSSYALWKRVFRKSGKKEKTRKASHNAPAPAKRAPAPVSASVKPAPVSMLESAARPAPAVRASAMILRYEGKIAGTAHDGRQGVLARLMKKENDGEVIDFSLEESTYQGKPSIKVMAEIFGEDAPPKQIGYIAAKDVGKVLPLIDTADVDVELYGGPDAGYDFEEGRDYLYGAAISLYTKA